MAPGHNARGPSACKAWMVCKACKPACAWLQGDRSVEDIVGFVTGEKVEKKAEEKPKDEDFFTGTGGWARIQGGQGSLGEMTLEGPAGSGAAGAAGVVERMAGHTDGPVNCSANWVNECSLPLACAMDRRPAPLSRSHHTI